MNIELSIRLSEILLATAFLQQAFEYAYSHKKEKALYIPMLVFALAIILGFLTKWFCLLLLLHALFVLKRFQGPYHGGADRMSLLVLTSLTLVHFLDGSVFEKYVWVYLALQVLASYFVAGCVKVSNPDWRSGKALEDLFAFSAFPASESLRALSRYKNLLKIASCLVIIFELSFPLFLISKITLILGLVLALSFHITNSFLFGFNRFIWAWLAAYPALLWMQHSVNSLPHFISQP